MNLNRTARRGVAACRCSFAWPVARCQAAASYRRADQWVWWRASRDSNAQTARSVVSHHPSPPVLLLPSRPRWSWSTGMSLIRVRHPSLPVTRGMVAMWSQFRPTVARHGVWQHTAAGRAAWGTGRAPDPGSGARCLEGGEPPTSLKAGQATARGHGLWVPGIRSPHATCAYSWISPPSRFRRTTLPAERATGGSAGPSGGACPKARCGRWPL